MLLVFFILFFTPNLVQGQMLGHLRKFEIIQERIDMIHQVPEIYFLEYKIVKKHDFHLPVMDLIWNITSKETNHYKVWIDGYERFGLENVYKKSAVSLVLTMCEFIGGKLVFNKDMHKFGNVSQTCPFPEAVYFLRDFYIDSTNLPPELPGNYWRLDIKMGLDANKHHDNKMCFFQYYFYIERNQRKLEILYEGH